MNNFQGFDDQKNEAGIVGLLAGSLSGIGTYIGSEWAWWSMGLGPWAWSGPSGRSATVHAYWLVIVGHLKASYEGDWGTWFSFESLLRNRHQYDAFVASFWIPLIVSVTFGILIGVRVAGAMNRKGASYLRGGKFS